MIVNNDNKFECDNFSKERFIQFLTDNNVNKSNIELLTPGEYLDIRFNYKNNLDMDYYVEIKERNIPLNVSELYLEEDKYNHLLRIGGSYGYLVCFIKDLNHMVIFKSVNILDCPASTMVASKHTVLNDKKIIKNIRLIDIKKGNYYLYQDNRYIKVDYSTFISQ